MPPYFYAVVELARHFLRSFLHRSYLNNHALTYFFVLRKSSQVITAGPLSIAAGVLAVVTAAIQSTEYLINTINGIKDAPEVISNINEDLNALHIALKQLSGAIQNSQSKIVGSEGIRKALETCSRACDSFARLLSKWTEDTAGDKISLWTRIKVHFGEDRIAGFREQLRDTKLTLIVSLGTATVYAEFIVLELAHLLMT